MAADSNTPTDIEAWIKKIIDSSTSLKQYPASLKLIQLYMNKLKHETSLSWDTRNFIETNLRNYRANKKLELIRNHR